MSQAANAHHGQRTTHDESTAREDSTAASDQAADDVYLPPTWWDTTLVLSVIAAGVASLAGLFARYMGWLPWFGA